MTRASSSTRWASACCIRSGLRCWLPRSSGHTSARRKAAHAQTAFADPRAREAKQLMVRLLRDKAAYEANVFADNNFLVSASVFPYFYGMVGDRNPKQAPKATTRSGYSPLAVDSFHIINKHGPISKTPPARDAGQRDYGNGARPLARRVVGQAAHHPRGLQAGRRRLLGRAVSLVAGSSERGHARFAGGVADRAGFEVSRRSAGGAAGRSREFLFIAGRPGPRARRDKRTASGARTQLRARRRARADAGVVATGFATVPELAGADTNRGQRTLLCWLRAAGRW